MTPQTKASEQTFDRPGGLLAWQWAHYSENHTDRRSLVIHALSAPLFWLGTVLIVVGAFTGFRASAFGSVGVVLSIVLQGIAHRFERVPPSPFRGPLDFVARFFVEQWVNFPRYVLSGEFRRALSRVNDARA